MFSRTIPYPLTYTSLTSHYLGYATTLRNSILTATCAYSPAKADRIFEVLLMGIRLCEQRMGTPEQINSLVDRRMDEMRVEQRAFVPWVFGEYPRYTGTRSGLRVGVENILRGGEREEREERTDDDDEDGIERNPALVSSPSSVYSDTYSTGSSDMPYPSRTSPHSPAMPTRRLYWSSFMAASNRPSPSSGPSSSLYPTSSTSSSPIDLWTELLTSLYETLSGYIAMYGSSGTRYSDYLPTIGLLEEAIEIAGERPGDVNPDLVWDLVEKRMLELREGREEVGGEEGQGDQGGDGDEAAQGEDGKIGDVEGDGKREEQHSPTPARRLRVSSPMYVAYHGERTPPEWR
jgi:hypothetical protein